MERLDYVKQEENWEWLIRVSPNGVLNGDGSLHNICTKYGIRSSKQLEDGIKVHNSGGILKMSTGGAYMKKARSTTLDERLKIVAKCLANDKNYSAMALKYQCSY